jgi:hypothetical protein
VDPLTSGYQLALVYDVIPTSSAFPRLPVLQPAVAGLQKVLEKWSDGYYANYSGQNLIAIVLTHKYDGEDLRLKTLRGEDHHRASHIRTVAEEMGYVVGLAQLRYLNLGTTDDSEYFDYDGCGRCESRLRDDEEMFEVKATFINIDNMVDFAGSPIPGFAKLKLAEANLILDKPFEDQTPDRAKVHRYGDLRDAYSNSDCDLGVRYFNVISSYPDIDFLITSRHQPRTT